MTDKKHNQHDSKNNNSEEKESEFIAEVPDLEPVTLSALEYDQLKKAVEEGKKNYDLLLRSQAEFDNFRKRTAKEKQELIKYAEMGIITDLLTVVDDFNRGLLSAEQSKDFNLLLQGVQMVQKHLFNILTQRGLEKIDCVGKPFDPSSQEAYQEKKSDIYEDGIVLEELQTGYLLYGKVLRTAKVTVVKNHQNTKQDEEKKSDSEQENK